LIITTLILTAHTIMPETYSATFPIKNKDHKNFVDIEAGTPLRDSSIIGSNSDKSQWAYLKYPIDKENYYISISPADNKGLFVGLHGLGRPDRQLILTPVRFLWKHDGALDGDSIFILTLNGSHAWSVGGENHSITLRPVDRKSQEQQWKFGS